ncbi:hypothetical protein AC578_9892 [Pseudocercospora eumusae]|uniref:Uncharacterized protein n=1 Tax=Pseudocercospora eumusae TaxID=321146 RepID=A0A139HB12_9PEZI|nr:hypothetical protein AC578_9892 [Pseudocercospora eumusae]
MLGDGLYCHKLLILPTQARHIGPQSVGISSRPTLSRHDANWFTLQGICQEKPQCCLYTKLLWRFDNGRVLELFLQELVGRKLLSKHPASTAEELKEEATESAKANASSAKRKKAKETDLKRLANSHPCPGYETCPNPSIINIMQCVYKKAFIYAARCGLNKPGTKVVNPRLTTMYRGRGHDDYLQYSRQDGRWLAGGMLPYLAVAFTTVAGPTIHSREIVELFWLLAASDEDLKRCILATANVDPSGKERKGFASHEMVELLNKNFEKDPAIISHDACSHG